MITIFTASYNRADTLKRLYDSLINQTCFDFEWVIVDDGSTDGTETIVSIFKNEKFNIKYKKNKHSGKHVAINTGLDLSEGDLFFLVDSDDYLPTNAIEIILSHVNEIEDEMCCGIFGRMVTTDGKLIGKKQQKNYYRRLCDDIRHNDIFDRADIVKTSIFKRFKYPVFEGEWHIAPGVPFIRMSNAGYKVLFLKDILYVADYQENGLTALRDRKLIDNYMGYTLRCRELVHSSIGLKKKAKIIIKYSWLSKNSFSHNVKTIAANLDIKKYLIRICLFIGKILKLLKIF